MSQPLVHTAATKQLLFRPASVTRKGIGNEDRRAEAQGKRIGVSVCRRIGVWGSKTAFRHGYSDQEVSAELMMLCKRRHTDTPIRRYVSPSICYTVISRLLPAGCCRVFNTLYHRRHRFDLFQHKIDLSRSESTLMSLRSPMAAPTSMSKDRIAIIGIGCRFPGGVNDTESFWKLLAEGREAVSGVPPDRWNVERFFDPEPGLPGKSIARRGGFLEGIDQFDPQFFGISPREAPYVDPQHRLLLETAWEAIEDAGLVLDLDRGTDLGVFVGISHNEYQGIQSTPWEHSGIGPHSPTGCAHSIAANRISYCFNLRGPSVAMDTACSSALTAVHAACEHIRAGRGDAALAGGVTVIITPGGFIGFSQASMLSPEGRCKAFDASANGFVRGEGAGSAGARCMCGRRRYSISDRICRSPRYRHRSGRPDRGSRARRGAVRRPFRGSAVDYWVREDKPGTSGNRGGRRRSGQGAAGSKAPADSGQPALRDAQSKHRLRCAEAPRAYRAGALPSEGWRADRRCQFVWIWWGQRPCPSD